jgi:hypothetical protein
MLAYGWTSISRLRRYIAAHAKGVKFVGAIMQIGMILTMFGLFSIIGTQLAAFCMAISLKHNGEAIKCLLIPLYQWVYVRKEKKAKPLKWLTVAAIISLILGVVLSA